MFMRALVHLFVKPDIIGLSCQFSSQLCVEWLCFLPSYNSHFNVCMERLMRSVVMCTHVMDFAYNSQFLVQKKDRKLGNFRANKPRISFFKKKFD